jgi:hypothetical protein
MSHHFHRNDHPGPLDHQFTDYQLSLEASPPGWPPAHRINPQQRFRTSELEFSRLGNLNLGERDAAPR